MKDQERTGLRRSAAVQIAAALTRGFPVDVRVAETAVEVAEAVIGRLEVREKEEEVARAEAQARAAAAKADTAAGVQQVEPH